MRSYLLSALVMLVLPATAYASCPAVTVADMKGVGMGAYPQQFELAEFEAAANCKCRFPLTRTLLP